MAKVVLVFVGGDSFIDEEIEKVSKSGDVNISHVAALLWGTYESTGIKEDDDPYPGVWIHRPNKFFDNPYARFIEIEVPDMNGFEAEARRLLGTRYGLPDCASTAVFDLTGIQLPDSDKLVHCSETITRLCRCGKMDVLPNIKAGCIDPFRIFMTVISDFDGQDVTYRYRELTP